MSTPSACGRSWAPETRAASERQKLENNLLCCAPATTTGAGACSWLSLRRGDTAHCMVVQVERCRLFWSSSDPFLFRTTYRGDIRARSFPTPVACTFALGRSCAALVARAAGAMPRETTPLVGGSPGPPPMLTHISRRLSALQPVALRRNSMRGTDDIIPAMGKWGSFLFLSNLITGAAVGCAWAVRLWAALGLASPLVAACGERVCRASGARTTVAGGHCRGTATGTLLGTLGTFGGTLRLLPRTNENRRCGMARPLWRAPDALARCAPQDPACLRFPPPTRRV